MIFDRVVGNLSVQGETARSVDDWVDIHWRDCFVRAARLRTRGGQDVRLLLPLGMQLRDGDVISDGAREVAVAVRPCDVLLLHPPDAKTALLAALGLGNLHAAVQLDGEQLITLPDGPVEELLNSLGVAYAVDVRRFEPTSIAAPLRRSLRVSFKSWCANARTRDELSFRRG